MLIEMNIFSFKKMHLKLSSAKWRLFRLDLNELITNLIHSIKPFPLRCEPPTVEKYGAVDGQLQFIFKHV